MSVIADPETLALHALRALRSRQAPPCVAVVGDVILDQFLYGTVERISPEAPVPVVEVDREVFRLGGAANVVNNLRALGARAELLGAVGRDGAAARLRRELEALGVSPEGLVEVEDRPTAVKTRVVAQHQQVVRFDRERRGRLPEGARGALAARVDRGAASWDAVVVSDYGKGVVEPELMDHLRDAARRHGTWIAVDPVPAHAELYRGVDILTPNVKETEAMTGLPARTDPDVERAGRVLLERLDLGAVLVTRGERGMSLLTREGGCLHIPTRARDVFDVTGAGDTAVAVLALARAAGAGLEEAACLANLAGGIVVGKLGTAVVTAEELEAAARDGFPDRRAPRGT